MIDSGWIDGRRDYGDGWVGTIESDGRFELENDEPDLCGPLLRGDESDCDALHAFFVAREKRRQAIAAGERFVTVRVAVGTTVDGDWEAKGTEGVSDATMAAGVGEAIEGAFRLSWVTAEVPLPRAEDPAEVVGVVEVAP